MVRERLWPGLFEHTHITKREVSESTVSSWEGDELRGFQSFPKTFRQVRSETAYGMAASTFPNLRLSVKTLNIYMHGYPNMVIFSCTFTPSGLLNRLTEKNIVYSHYFYAVHRYLAMISLFLSSFPS